MTRPRAFLLLLLAAVIAAAPVPASAELRTVSWNPSTAYTDGTQFAQGTTVAYDVFWSTDPALTPASLRTIATSVAGTSATFDPDSSGMPRGTVVYVTADAVLNTGEKSAFATAFAWNAPTLSSLSISGPSSVNESGSATYAATATWSDGTTTTVAPTWSENSAYASISAGGVLTTTSVTANQAATVSASYTAGGVTRTASASVTIVNVAAALSSLSISGPSSVNENGSATYAATAAWSDGTTTTVTASASWSTTLGTISGGVLAAPSVTANQPATVSASYTAGGLTRTASASVTIVNVAATLSSLSISGPSSVNENGSATYTATATWSDGTTTTVAPAWSENSAYASISAGGVLTTTAVTANQPATISASYTAGAVTRTASASVTIVDIPATLSSLSLSGPSSVNEGGSATYAATATWSDGTTTTVTASASWSTTLGTISGGVLAAPSVTGNQPATVSATYTATSGGSTATRTAQMTVTIVNVVSLSGLSIDGPASVNEGDTANYVATATWSDGTTTTVTAVASWATTLGTISAGGLTAPAVAASQTATVSATYTGGTAGTTATRTAQLAVTIADVPTTTPSAPLNVDVSGPVATSPSQLFRVKWDAVKTYADGTPITTDNVTYTAYWTTDPGLSPAKLQLLAPAGPATTVDFDPAKAGMKKNQRIFLTTKAVLSSGGQSSLAAAVSWKASNSGPFPPANGRIYKRQ